jgi:ABC-2 type transport system permease protein
MWSLVLCAWIILLFGFYPTFIHFAPTIDRVLTGYPEAVKDLIGLSNVNVTNLLGFYTFAFQGVLELGAVQAMILGASIIFKEVSRKTAEFLFTRPVSRQQIMTAKLFAAGVSLAITNIIYFIVAGISASLVSAAVNLKIFFMISITLFFVQLIFMSLGVLIAVIFPRIKSATAIAIGTLFLIFLAYDTLKPIVGGYAIRYLIPFEYLHKFAYL